MNAQEILNIALRASGLTEVPEDSGVIVDGDNIKRVLFGVDVEGTEMLIAKELGYDAVITHHPKGGEPMVNLYKVMNNQIDRMVKAGVPINKAQKALEERMGEVDRGHHVGNYDRAVSAAKLLKMPFIGIHTPADILAEKTVQDFLDKKFSTNQKTKLKDIINALNEIPEYKLTLAKPKIRVGSEESYAGKIFVTMAGGTGGGKNVAKAYFEAGIGTLVVMHMPEDVLRAVREQNIGNVIVAGHMASDSIGINKVIEALERKGLSVTRMSGVVDPKQA
ncbi:Nif3-like dinuclear metal center hexameric protein [Bacillota bacterium LX-D]|nr:Nif3-like dinuclear metal center hexameric protein [Bacillota bacterium LX-D]